MATHNDITGDRLINTPKPGARTGTQQRRGFSYDMPEFKVLHCNDCHIKVSTSNGLCPCCQRSLIKEKQNVGTNADGSAVSVSSVSSAGCTGQVGESGSDNSQGSAD